VFFIFIFLAALPGRTTFILVMLASNSKAKNVFFGAASAFLIQASLSVLLGQLLTLIPEAYVSFSAGILFLYFSWKFWVESRTKESGIENAKTQSIKSVFILIFMAEVGDVSQLAIATSASKTLSKLNVFLVSVCALWIITLLAIVVGRNLRRFINFGILQRIASFVFLAVGIYFLTRFEITLWK